MFAAQSHELCSYFCWHLSYPTTNGAGGLLEHGLRLGKDGEIHLSQQKRGDGLTNQLRWAKVAVFLCNQQKRDSVHTLNQLSRIFPNALAPHTKKSRSDLAFELCLNIPPAVLHVRKNPGDPDDPQAEGEERHVVLSLVPDGRIEELDEKRANDRIKESLANYCGIVAFDAWLGNIDRGFDKNILVNYGDPNNAWFIDYCFTMDYNFRWQGDGYQCFKKLKVPSLMLPGLREGRVKKVIARIQDLDPQVIREICLRLPDAFLRGIVRTTCRLADLAEGRFLHRLITGFRPNECLMERWNGGTVSSEYSEYSSSEYSGHSRSFTVLLRRSPAAGSRKERTGLGKPVKHSAVPPRAGEIGHRYRVFKPR